MSRVPRRTAAELGLTEEELAAQVALSEEVVAEVLEEEKLPRHMLRFWTGPAAVVEVAGALREIGYAATEGTEHVWVEEHGSDGRDAAERVRARLRLRLGKDFGIELREQRRVDGRGSF